MDKEKDFCTCTFDEQSKDSHNEDMIVPVDAKLVGIYTDMLMAFYSLKDYLSVCTRVLPIFEEKNDPKYRRYLFLTSRLEEVAVECGKAVDIFEILLSFTGWSDFQKCLSEKRKEALREFFAKQRTAKRAN